MKLLDIITKSTHWQWFNIICTLVDDDIHHSSQNVVESQDAADSVLNKNFNHSARNIIVNKSKHHSKPLSICFYYNINVR